jgi:hypothetical protein
MQFSVRVPVIPLYQGFFRNLGIELFGAKAADFLCGTDSVACEHELPFLSRQAAVVLCFHVIFKVGKMPVTTWADTIFNALVNAAYFAMQFVVFSLQFVGKSLGLFARLLFTNNPFAFYGKLVLKLYIITFTKYARMSVWTKPTFSLLTASIVFAGWYSKWYPAFTTLHLNKGYRFNYGFWHTPLLLKICQDYRLPAGLFYYPIITHW